ncbi:hypothetical protein D910_01612 [Dendroctonus ponderosae]|uniref:Uncharacterized protein n=1 Tax=Dendroctonus ponderosae TaxID=77166 RepID=U4V0Q4_DENPD|nr:hypothetical protein D910_01612 [Dendroctonus ponderosae]
MPDCLDYCWIKKTLLKKKQISFDQGAKKPHIPETNENKFPKQN